MADLRRMCRLAAVGAVWLSAIAGHAQAVPPETTVSAALRSLASRASLAFVGQVERTERKGGVVEITFRVEQPVLGAASGEYVLREWAGLWPPGQRRYVAGQRLLIFLHAASAAGLSSPVDGMEGMLPVVAQGADAAPLLDVRRLNVRLLRAKGSAMPNAAGGALRLADAGKVIANWQRSAGPEPAQVQLAGSAEVEANVSVGQDSADAVR